MSRPPTTEAVFEPIGRDVRLSDKVAAQLLDSIVTRRLRPGDRLPSERDMAEQFLVSRTVVREAIRSLASRGLIEAQSGARLTVARISTAPVIESMSLLVNSLGGVGYAAVHEVRSVLEMATVELAAERATPADISMLRNLSDGLVKPDLTFAEAAHLDVGFHRQLAQATKNELFVALLDSIADVLLNVRIRGFSRPSGIEYAHGAHGRILDRVAAHDIAGARLAMQRHLEESLALIGDIDGSLAAG